ncbi:hypothetical protein [Pseudosulfitobacter pseudonitzschiae]|uniref:hypothetical protein n=1 Tax=Pseudosulfitobacter pseudonitzschiae TaxID=1402135 RepID=UPI001AF8D294|nr:hypothetical protein [Pseudosulfitobacter pseudonitzschiae]MBM1816243.1 hypothetical protein [Pseudosulfitobacter pseudonitzschiae]MBM1833742.1 hypothetical protein [Pseudosulfitobacter pseudonitzschiae]MBM1838608.1 hypothetical protein [Pseudosulfitobacter pseudonitzschiae]MBM1842956.1 hypothetical protein [Pseudosulfitobacter pseudonitzschiae]MBM1847822.1 hypothetical protein [Pseudosulfitobacter pseudonitzschiae]
MQFLSRVLGRESLWIALLTFVTVFFGMVRRDAAKDRDRDATIQELEHAQDIRNRVERADRDRLGGVREFELAGWRDDDPGTEGDAD